MEHVRIDEGIKRGPRKPGPLPGLPQRGSSNPILPVDSNQRNAMLAQAVTRYANGERLQDIADDLNCSREAIRVWMLDECPDQYRSAQTQGLLAKVAMADEAIEDAVTARDLVALAGARERARFSRMDLERRRSSLYGPKQEINVTVQPILNIAVVQNPDAALLPAIPGTCTKSE